MTENKRFRVFKYPDCKEYGVSDDIAEYTLARFDNHFEAETLCELLNDLNDEVKSQSLVIKGYQERTEKLFNENEQLKDALNQRTDQCDKYYKENEQLKQCLNEAKNDEKQLGIDFMGFKMKLIEQLRIHYDYASEQKQNNLDNPLVAKAYDIIRYDVKKLAEEMRVDLE